MNEGLCQVFGKRTWGVLISKVVWAPRPSRCILVVAGLVPSVHVFC